MREITESQAQELADLTGLFIAVDRPFRICTNAFTKEPIANEYLEWWESGGEVIELPIRIISSRPWTEQIWRPKAK